MKLKIAILLIALTTTARASLIDLTPGGFSFNNFPPVVTDFYTNTRPFLYLFDQSAFNISGEGTPTATFSWEFHGTPANLQWVIAVNNNDPDNVFGNLYRVTMNQWKSGEADVVVDGNMAVTLILGFGHPPFEVPDSGSTLMLFGIALLTLPLWKLKARS